MPGMHVALNRDEAKQLFSLRDPESLGKWLTEDLTPRIESLPHFRTEDWQMMHRLLGDGTLASDGGEYPLNHCYLGSRPLNAGDRTVHVIRPDTVGHLALALSELDAEQITARLKSMPSDDAGAPGNDAATSVSGHIGALQQFFHDAATEQCAVLFVVV